MIMNFRWSPDTRGTGMFGVPKPSLDWPSLVIISDFWIDTWYYINQYYINQLDITSINLILHQSTWYYINQLDITSINLILHQSTWYYINQLDITSINLILHQSTWYYINQHQWFLNQHVWILDSDSPRDDSRCSWMLMAGKIETHKHKLLMLILDQTKNDNHGKINPTQMNN